MIRNTPHAFSRAARPLSTARKTWPVLAACLSLVLSSASIAYADHWCVETLGFLKTAIGQADFIIDTDRTKLVYKVEDISLKVHVGKYADAEQKLADISTKVKALRDAPKPKIVDDPTTLENEIEVILSRIDDALLCIPNGLAALPHN